MRLTKRGKIILGAGAVAVGIIALSTILALAGKGPAALRAPANALGVPDKSSPPPVAPLTGKEEKSVPDRPALAIKVENLPEARPQAGLNKADIVYEEPVEGGITRFIVIYQSQDSDRVGPVRSGRLTDAPVLLQYGTPVFGYAGGVPQVVESVRDAGIKDVNFNIAPQAYHLDPNRSMPHNTYTSTKELYKAAHYPKGAPDPMFEYGDIANVVKPAAFAHLDYSGESDVYWRWDAKNGDWLRYHGDVPHMLEGDVQVSAKNVVVQVVKVDYNTGIQDVAGSASPEAITVGSGKAYVFRDGKVIVGTWVRQGQDDVTKFLTKSGDVINLAPGRTWVELFPNDDQHHVEFGAK